MVEKSEKIIVLGPGESLNRYSDFLRKPQKHKTLAFQGVFPHCYHSFKIVPDYWVSADPNAFVEGFNYLNDLNKEESEKFKKMQILVPKFCSEDYSLFRAYCGTTPLGRVRGAWKKYNFLLDSLKRLGYNIIIVDCTTTKHIKLFEEKTDNIFKNFDILGEDAYARFMYHRPIFGTIEFDSESVVGDKFKWGLENKLTSAVFPICYYLGAKEVYIAGFDFKGGRFYNPRDDRHPWNDESQDNFIHDFPLSIIKKWIDWIPYHGMNFYSIVESEYTLLNQVVEYKNFFKERENNDKIF